MSVLSVTNRDVFLAQHAADARFGQAETYAYVLHAQPFLAVEPANLAAFAWRQILECPAAAHPSLELPPRRRWQKIVHASFTRFWSSPSSAVGWLRRPPG